MCFHSCLAVADILLHKDAHLCKLRLQFCSCNLLYPCIFDELTLWFSFDFTVSLETTSSSKKKRKVKSMFPLSAVADSKSKTVTREECIELAKINYGRQDHL